MNEAYVNQVGGDHYQSEYQHWDWAPDIVLGYLEGNATKYVDRYKKKGIPLQDLEKAKTYVEKTIAKHQTFGYRNNSILVGNNQGSPEQGVRWTQKFSKSSGHNSIQSAFMMTMAGWQNEGDLRVALGFIDRMLRTATDALEAQQVPQATHAPSNANTSTGGAQGGAAVPVFTSSRANHPSPFGYEED